jgi:hypothetical protein
MVAALSRFPETITADDGYRRLQKALVGTGFSIDGKTKGGQKAVREARVRAGILARQTAQGWIWVRNE